MCYFIALDPRWFFINWFINFYRGCQLIWCWHLLAIILIMLILSLPNIPLDSLNVTFVPFFTIDFNFLGRVLVNFVCTLLLDRHGRNVLFLHDGFSPLFRKEYIVAFPLQLRSKRHLVIQSCPWLVAIFLKLWYVLYINLWLVVKELTDVYHEIIIFNLFCCFVFGLFYQFLSQLAINPACFHGRSLDILSNLNIDLCLCNYFWLIFFLLDSSVEANLTGFLLNRHDPNKTYSVLQKTKKIEI